MLNDDYTVGYTYQKNAIKYSTVGLLHGEEKEVASLSLSKDDEYYFFVDPMTKNDVFTMTMYVNGNLYKTLDVTIYDQNDLPYTISGVLEIEYK